MNKRILRSMNLLVVFMVTVFAVLGLLVSRQFGTRVKEGLKTLRVTMISESGDVIFDNQADSSEMDNHMTRPEVIAALEHGSGESERYSATLRETTYYYAVRLNDGSILRLALTTDSVYANIYRLIPVVIICLLVSALLAFLVAKRLTKHITAPINSINLDDPDVGNYDELLPLVKRMEAQKQEIAAKVSELKNREDTLENITENMQEGLLLLDNTGTVITANRSALLILNTDEAQGKNIVEVCRDSDFIEKMRESGSGHRTESVLRREDRIYNAYFNPVHEAEGKAGTVILLMDATGQYAAERHRKEFSANVSHELKTPLTTISALSEMIADGTAKQQDVQRFGEKISVQSRRLINIIDDIIKLSEFDEGEMAKDFSRFDLHDLVKSVTAGLHEKAAQKNVTVEIQGEGPLLVHANRRMMDELLYNLLDNAIKYNHDGGAVKISLVQESKQYKITVRDTGIGIPDDHLDRVFERFYRVDKSRSKKTGGTGLGLSIVKHIAEFHRGSVRIESDVDAGTCVTCVFPM